MKTIKMRMGMTGRIFAIALLGLAGRGFCEGMISNALAELGGLSHSEIGVPMPGGVVEASFRGEVTASAMPQYQHAILKPLEDSDVRAALNYAHSLWLDIDRDTAINRYFIANQCRLSGKQVNMLLEGVHYPSTKKKINGTRNAWLKRKECVDDSGVQLFLLNLQSLWLNIDKDEALEKYFAGNQRQLSSNDAEMLLANVHYLSTKERIHKAWRNARRE